MRKNGGRWESNGSVALTLEDWFDPRRLKADYLPTGFIGYGIKTRAVTGHEFGLKLSERDKRALIAFLRTFKAVPRKIIGRAVVKYVFSTGGQLVTRRANHSATV